MPTPQARQAIPIAGFPNQYFLPSNAIGTDEAVYHTDAFGAGHGNQRLAVSPAPISPGKKLLLEHLFPVLIPEHQQRVVERLSSRCFHFGELDRHLDDVEGGNFSCVSSLSKPARDPGLGDVDGTAVHALRG